jgi:hypothetical protein
MKIMLFVLLLCGASASLAAQGSSTGASWDRLKHLPPQTRVHVAADNQSKVCAIDLVDDATLQCSKGHSQYSFARAEVKSVKLTRYTRSTLVGLGIGLGVGAGVGAIAGHAEEKPNDFFPGLTTDAFAAIGGAVGAIAGAAIGGPTDFMRGPTLYRRP